MRNLSTSVVLCTTLCSTFAFGQQPFPASCEAALMELPGAAEACQEDLIARNAGSQSSGLTEHNTSPSDEYRRIGPGLWDSVQYHSDGKFSIKKDYSAGSAFWVSSDGITWTTATVRPSTSVVTPTTSTLSTPFVDGCDPGATQSSNYLDGTAGELRSCSPTAFGGMMHEYFFADGSSEGYYNTDGGFGVAMNENFVFRRFQDDTPSTGNRSLYFHPTPYAYELINAAGCWDGNAHPQSWDADCRDEYWQAEIDAQGGGPISGSQACAQEEPVTDCVSRRLTEGQETLAAEFPAVDVDGNGQVDHNDVVALGDQSIPDNFDEYRTHFGDGEGSVDAQMRYIVGNGLIDSLNALVSGDANQSAIELMHLYIDTVTLVVGSEGGRYEAVLFPAETVIDLLSD